MPKGWEEGEGFQLTCPKGHYNDLATAFLGSDVFVIRTLLNLGSEALPIKKDVSERGRVWLGVWWVRAAGVWLSRGSADVCREWQ